MNKSEFEQEREKLKKLERISGFPAHCERIGLEKGRALTTREILDRFGCCGTCDNIVREELEKELSGDKSGK